MEEDKEELALTLASMLGHQLRPDSYEEGLYETIRQYKKLTGKDTFDKILPINLKNQEDEK